MLENGNDRRVAVRDLSSLVTVYVTTVGAPSFATCMEHLKQQDCTFDIQVIDHVAPMTAAFQRMLDTCRTPYYVQVDEDMILFPHAVRTLYQRITDAEPDVVMYAADLFDCHLQRCIIGVKIFRHEIVRSYPLGPIDAFEVEQVARMEAHGYQVVRAAAGTTPVEGQTLGLHGTEWTDASIYERYFNLMRRRRTHVPPALQWFDEYPPRFLERFMEDPSEQNFFALMGIVAGVIGSRHGLAESKDFRSYERLPGLEASRTFLAECEAASPETVVANMTSTATPTPGHASVAPVSTNGHASTQNGASVHLQDDPIGE
jgi:hypothetical protein